MRIYFDTPTFDRITKDRAAKFVEDMLSAIGGTMGLLTGFSIISAVEIFYFAMEIILRNKVSWNVFYKLAVEFCLLIQLGNSNRAVGAGSLILLISGLSLYL